MELWDPEGEEVQPRDQRERGEVQSFNTWFHKEKDKGVKEQEPEFSFFSSSVLQLEWISYALVTVPE